MSSKSALKKGYFYSPVEVALRRIENGDYVGGVSLLRNAEEDGLTTPEVYAALAEAYFDIEAYTFSLEYWFKFLSVTKSHYDRARGYNGVAACYCRVEDVAMLTYYYDKEQKSAAQLRFDYDNLEFKYDELILDSYEALSHYTERKLERMARLLAEGVAPEDESESLTFDLLEDDFYSDSDFYSVDFPPSEKLLWESANLMSAGEYEKAYDILKAVPESSECYVDARLNMASSLGALDRHDEAISILEKLAEEKPDDGTALLGCAVYFADLNRSEESKHYALLAAYKPKENDEDYCRAAYLLLDFGETEMAAYNLDECLKINPYDFKALILKGEIEYNAGRKDKAAEAFKKTYDLTRSEVARYYYLNSLPCEAGAPRKLSYRFTLPEVERSFKEASISLCIARGKKFVQEQPLEDIYDLCEWCFAAPCDLQAEFARAVFKACPTLREYLIKKLVSERVDLSVKFAIIEELVLGGYKRTVAVTMMGIFMETKIIGADFGKTKVGKKFKKAYASAFAKTCLFDERAEKLPTIAADMFAAIENMGNMDRVDDVNALAGAILYYGEYEACKKRGFFEKVMNTSKKKVKAIARLADYDSYYIGRMEEDGNYIKSEDDDA